MKPVYLLDSNVISEFTKSVPNPAVIKKAMENDGLCAICSTVWQEAVYGLEIMPDGKRKQMVEEIIRNLRESYEIIPYNDFAAKICGEIWARCKEAGTPVPFYDSQIAATAIANNMILITHNTEDYAALAKNSMLQIEDWWE